MDKKQDFAERRRRQKEKLSLQRAERRIANSTPIETALTKHSDTADALIAESPGSSENTDDAYVHVDKADAAEADVDSAPPFQKSGNVGVATKTSAGFSRLSKHAPSPVKQPEQHPATFPSAASPASMTAEATGSLQDNTEVESKQAPAQAFTAPSGSSETTGTPNLQPAPQSPPQERSAKPAVPSQAGTQRSDVGGQSTETPQSAQGAASERPVSNIQSSMQKQLLLGAKPEAGPSHNSASSSAPTKEAEAARPGKSPVGSCDAVEAGKCAGSSDTAGRQAAVAASSGSWGWGKGWLPTAALQQVAAGALKDVREMKESLQQAFASEDPETATDEDESMPEAQHDAPAGASEAERHAVLERLQGQDNHLAAGFKLLDRQIDTVLGGAAGLAGSLLGRAHSAGRQVAGKVEVGLELFGQSAIRLLDGGLDYSKLPPNTFAAHFRHNGGSDVAERLEELCNDSARLCNRLRSVLTGAELEAFNTDVAGMAAYLDTASLAGTAAGQKDVLRPVHAPDLDPLIIEATCREGAESLKAWHGRKVDGFALWGLHDSACAELAEAAAECVEELNTFGIELSGSAAAKAGSQPAAGAFSGVADYLQSKARAMVAALTLLADAYLAVADKAAAKALAAFKAEQGSASSKSAGADRSSVPGAGQDSPGSSTCQAASQARKGWKQVTWERYPDHVHDPLKVQLELGNVKAAALQTVTELYRGLLYVALHHCHGQRSL